MKKLTTFIAMMLIVGVCYSQTLKEIRGYVSVTAIGMSYSDLRERISEEERLGLGELRGLEHNKAAGTIVIRYMDHEFSTGFVFGLITTDQNPEGRVITQTEFAPITQLDHYINALNVTVDSNLIPFYRSETEKWVWYFQGDGYIVKYDLYINNNQTLLKLEVYIVLDGEDQKNIQNQPKKLLI